MVGEQSAIAAVSVPDAILAVLNALTAHAAILDDTGRIYVVNEAWKVFGADNGLRMSDFAVGHPYVAHCSHGATDDCTCPAHTIATTIESILQGRDAECTVEYDCHSPTEKRWFVARVKPIHGVPPMKVLVVHENITPLRLAEQELRRSNVVLTRLVKLRSEPVADTDLVRVARACGTREQRLILYTLIDLGLRVSELTTLDPADFNWEAGTLTVRPTSGEPDEAPRVLPVPQRTLDVWRDYLTSKKRFSLSVRQVQRIVKAVGAAANLPEPLAPKVLRHTFAVRLIESGASPELLSYAMGYRQDTPVQESWTSELAPLMGAVRAA